MLPRLFAPTESSDPGTNKTKIMEICSFFSFYYTLSIANNQATRSNALLLEFFIPPKKLFLPFFGKIVKTT